MTTDQAIAYFGSASKLAEALGITPAAVSQWGEYPPPLRQFHIQAATRNKLKAEQPGVAA